MNADQSKFLTEQYVPAFRAAMAENGVNLGFLQRLSLGLKGVGFLVKMGWGGLGGVGGGGGGGGGEWGESKRNRDEAKQNETKRTDSSPISTHPTAFVWQEEMFKGDFLRNAKINALGGDMCKYVNMLGNALTGFTRSDKDFQACVNVYPGDAACRVGSSPHA